MGKTIAMDFDDTFTAIPDIWASTILDLEAAGHRVFIATGRRETEENLAEIRGCLREHGLVLPIVCSSMGSKLHAFEARGIKVDIWIEDNPHSLVKGL